MLLLELEHRSDHTCGGVRDDHVERPRLGEQQLEPLRVADVPAEKQGLGAEPLDLGGRLLRCPVTSQVADGDAAGAERGESKRDLPADTPGAASDQNGLALERAPRAEQVQPQSELAARAARWLGIVSQPMRVDGSSGPSRAFVVE